MRIKYCKIYAFILAGLLTLLSGCALNSECPQYTGNVFLDKTDLGYIIGYDININDNCDSVYIANFKDLISEANKIANDGHANQNLSTDFINEYDYTKACDVWYFSNGNSEFTSSFNSHSISVIPSEKECYEELYELVNKYKGKLEIETQDGKKYKDTFSMLK